MSLPYIFDLHRLREQLEQALCKQINAGITDFDLFSVSLEIPAVPLDSLPPVSAPYFYMAQPDQGWQQLGLGEAWRYEAKGIRRFEKLATELVKRLHAGRNR